MAMLPSNAAAAAVPGSRQLTAREQAYVLRMGERGYKTFEALKKEERQRVWDSMRRVAAARHKDGLMPGWFRREWLDIQEAPTNTWWRQQGLSAYRTDTSWLGDNAPAASSGGGSGSSGGGSGGGGGGGWGPRWWRHEDPYWPLRDWGDHPMRWWTWGLAAVLAAGGVAAHAQTGDPLAVFIGLGSASLLALCGVAMSDMQGGSTSGELGAKGGFAICSLLALADLNSQRGLQPTPQQQDPACYSPFLPKRWQQQQQPGWGANSNDGNARATGWLCLCAAGLYMWTGMSGLWEGSSLPDNPGAAFKMVDVAQRHKIWDYWGYSGFTMR